MDRPTISNVRLNLGCRHEVIPILAALKHIYAQPKLRDEILQAVAHDVDHDSSSERGCEGMDYWPIMVPVSVRLGCNFNYDRLQDLAEQHGALRQMMGIGEWDKATDFNWRTIRNNLALLRPETLERINHAIVAEGHRLVPEAAETVRGDPSVAGTNIHYPTESSLIRDGLRKVLSLCGAIATLVGGRGWRQDQHLYQKAKSLARQIDRVAAPSLMLMTTGGKQLGCSLTNWQMTSWAARIAPHMGVLPVARGSNQTGNLTCRCISPPAPSSSRLTRSSIRRG
jgi:hypothetical protein